MRLIFAILLALSFLNFSAQAGTLTAQQRESDFNQLVGQIRSSYGPLEYKQKVQNINVDQLVNQYRELILQAKSNQEFYNLILKFVAEFKDSHFSARVPSERAAKLPFYVDLVDGKVLIDAINRDKLPESKFPFQRGDEVVSFNSRPIMEVVNEMVPYMGQGYSLTAKRLATILLTGRKASRLQLPTGNVTMEIRSAQSKIIQSAELTWENSGADFETIRSPWKKSSPLKLDELSLAKRWQEELGSRFEYSYMCSSKSRIKRPENLTVIMEEPFVAYYYPTAKGNVGYLRIPHYMPSMLNKNGKPLSDEEAFAYYEYAIHTLEKNTVGLIIDQDHNCGGSVDYLHNLVSLFIQHPVQQMQFRLRASKENLISMKSELDSADPKTLVYEKMKALFDLLKLTWDKGEYLTSKTSITTEQWIYPHTVRYTKPVLMLIDELSGSGGDAFPALMQGYGRAVLMGTRTMGAGGHVTEMPSLNFSQIRINMTQSLFYRPDGVEVENNGAVPNIPYIITAEDFTDSYVKYRETYTQKLLELL